MADCGACGRKVAKSAKALACDFCRLWYHISCAGLTDSDYDFMKSRKGLGFRWFCGKCISSADGAMGSDHTANQVDEKLSNIVAAVEEINLRLGDLEVRTGSTGDSGPVSFADVVRKTFSEVKRFEEPDLFKISKRNCFVLLGRLEIIEYSISSSPGDVGEDNEIAWSNSSMVKGRL